MEKSDASTPESVEEKSASFLNGLNKVLRIAAYPISAIVGLWVVSKDAHSSVFEKAKTVEGNVLFADINRKFTPQYAENANKLVRGAISTEDFLAREIAIKAEHSPAVGERMARMGMSNDWFGLKDLPAKWKYINRNSKQRAIIEGLTVSGITIGALLTIADSRLISNLFRTRDKDKDENAR